MSEVQLENVKSFVKILSEKNTSICSQINQRYGSPKVSKIKPRLGKTFSCFDGELEKTMPLNFRQNPFEKNDQTIEQQIANKLENQLKEEQKARINIENKLKELKKKVLVFIEAKVKKAKNNS